MYSYALKRLVRGRAIFIALFLSIALAASLFSGILQGADTVGATMLNQALESTDIDIVSSAEERNLTKTSFSEVEEAIKNLENVVWVEHIIRSIEQPARFGIEVNITGLNDTIPITVAAIDSNSNLVKGISGIERLEPNKIYIVEGSMNASLFREGEEVILQVPTYIPGGSLVQIEKRFIDYSVGEMVQIDNRLFSIAFGRYSDFLVSLLSGSGQVGQRPPHKLVIISEESFLDWMNSIYAEGRRHTRALVAETVIGLERRALLNPWNLEASIDNVDQVYNRINGLGAQYMFVPVNYLTELLNYISSVSNQLKTNTLLLAAPIFFTAWYLGVTVSEIALGLRRREIGLLFTRGLTDNQIFFILMFEAAIVSIFAGLVGILLGGTLIPLVMPRTNISQVFASISPVTIGISFVFSCALALIAVYKPARDAVNLEVVDALREYQEETASSDWKEPVLALSLGTYRIIMLILGITVEQFRPDAGNLIVFLLYSTWWGTDFILNYIAPILFFWGFTKLFVQYLPWLYDFLGKLIGKFVGDVGMFSILSAKRHAKRTAAFTFMTALIVGYGVLVIGGVTSTDDFVERFTRHTIGADASVWLFERKDAESIKERILQVEGVTSATVEKWLEAESVIGVIPIRIIDPLEWREIAYREKDWILFPEAFQVMNESHTHALLEMGAAYESGVTLGDPWLIRLGDRVHTFALVGFFGKMPSPNWQIQNPTLYISSEFEIKEEYLDISRVLVKLDETIEIDRVKRELETIDPLVQGVDIADNIVDSAYRNIFLTGAKRIEELGVYFAALVSSVGIFLIVSTAMRSRVKELTVMSIRGFSNRQLAVTLLVENLGMTFFSIILGLGVGLVMLRGEIDIFNTALSAAIHRRVVIPISAQFTLVGVVALLVASTIIPILIMVRHVSQNPTWRIQE